MAEKKKGKPILLLLGGTLAGLFIGRLLGNLELFEESLFETLGPWWTVLGIVVMAFLALLIHELGHVIGGRSAGFQFVMLVVGPFKVVREADGLRLRWNTSLGLAGGLAALLPRKPPTKEQLRAYILGGPVASWVGAVTLLALGYAGTQLASGVVKDLSGIAMFGAFISFAIGCITLIPSRMGGFDSDGAQWRDIQNGGHRAERKMVMYALMGEAMNGVRPRDWTPHFIEKASTLPREEASPVDVALAFFLYQHNLDRGKVAQAQEALTAVIAMSEAYPAPARGSLYVEAAYFEARHKGDLASAHDALEQATGRFVEKAARLRAEAAIAWLNGQYTEGQQLAKDALAALSKSTFGGNNDAEKDWLESLIADCEQEVAFAQASQESSG